LGGPCLKQIEATYTSASTRLRSTVGGASLGNAQGNGLSDLTPHLRGPRRRAHATLPTYPDIRGVMRYVNKDRPPSDEGVAQTTAAPRALAAFSTNT
jgi:hypothetical protein